MRCGPWIWVDPREHLGNVVYWMGDSDPRITRLCRALLRPGDTALDLGANCGVEALAMAQTVGPRGRVVSCEPNAKCAIGLRRSAEANGFAHLEVRQAAVTNHPGTVRFDPSDVSVTGHISVAGSEIVDAIDAGALFAELAPIRLVKIDVEGHEAVILEAAQDAIAKSPPDYILFESLRGQPFWGRPEVLRLASLGYSFAHISRRLVGQGLVGLPPGREPGRGVDFLAYRS